MVGPLRPGHATAAPGPASSPPATRDHQLAGHRFPSPQPHDGPRGPAVVTGAAAAVRIRRGVLFEVGLVDVVQQHAAAGVTAHILVTNARDIAEPTIAGHGN